MTVACLFGQNLAYIILKRPDLARLIEAWPTLPEQIKTKIKMSLWASYADNNIKKEHMRISKKSEGINVRVKYEVRKPFLGNIDIIASFDRSVILRK